MCGGRTRHRRASRKDEALRIPDRPRLCRLCRAFRPRCARSSAAHGRRRSAQAARIDGMTPAALTAAARATSSRRRARRRRDRPVSLQPIRPPKTSPKPLVFHVKRSSGSRPTRLCSSSWQKTINLVAPARWRTSGTGTSPNSAQLLGAGSAGCAKSLARSRQRRRLSRAWCSRSAGRARPQVHAGRERHAQSGLPARGGPRKPGSLWTSVLRESKSSRLRLSLCRVDVVTARALAPLARLLELCAPLFAAEYDRALSQRARGRSRDRAQARETGHSSVDAASRA